MFADSHNIWNRQKNYFCQLLIYMALAISGRQDCIRLSH